MEEIESNSDDDYVEDKEIEMPTKQEKKLDFPTTYIFRDVTESSGETQKSTGQSSKSRIW